MGKFRIKRKHSQEDQTLASKVKSVFGSRALNDTCGRFCLVHLDNPDGNTRTERVRDFRPECLFDPNCPHCKTFLTQGAFVVYTTEGVIGFRLEADGYYEIVNLTTMDAPSLARLAASSVC